MRSVTREERGSSLIIGHSDIVINFHRGYHFI